MKQAVVERKMRREKDEKREKQSNFFHAKISLVQLVLLTSTKCVLNTNAFSTDLAVPGG